MRAVKTAGVAGMMVMAGVIVAGCRFPGLGGPKAPTGQVVAVVDGKEITQLELQAELGGAAISDPKARKAVEQQALQQIIIRRLLADAARKERLDKTPDFAVQQRRMEDGLLAQTLQKKLASAVPSPSDDETRRYVDQHPDMFAQRKIYALETIRMAPASQTVMDGLKPLNTLADVDAYLTANHVEHQRGLSNLDALTANPKLIEGMVKLPAGAVFIYPENGYMAASQIKDTQLSPIAPDAAAQYAAAELKQQRLQEAAAREVRDVMAQATGKVQYNPAYAPPPAKAGAKVASPAA